MHWNHNRLYPFLHSFTHNSIFPYHNPHSSQQLPTSSPNNSIPRPRATHKFNPAGLNDRPPRMNIQLHAITGGTVSKGNWKNRAAWGISRRQAPLCSASPVKSEIHDRGGQNWGLAKAAEGVHFERLATKRPFVRKFPLSEYFSSDHPLRPLSLPLAVCQRVFHWLLANSTSNPVVLVGDAVHAPRVYRRVYMYAHGWRAETFRFRLHPLLARWQARRRGWKDFRELVRN